MSLVDEVLKFGVNMDDAMQRFMNDRNFYEKMLRKLPKSIAENDCRPFFQAGQFVEAIAPAHTLKGLMANFSLQPLYQGYTKIVADLRAGNYDAAQQTYSEILPMQEELVEVIKANS